jgi:uncharacterized protein (UPF0548 family)
MDLYLTDQSKKFTMHLEHLCEKSILPYEKNKLKDKVSTIELSTTKNYENLDLDPLFNYQIFPHAIMTSFTQWQAEQRTLNVGDNIIQQVVIPPSEYFSLKLIFGVRIKEIINEATRKGFSYETLEGHVEKGISTFTIEKAADNKIVFVIHTLSEPANTLSKLTAPLFALPYQNFCTRRALQNVKNIFDCQ